MRRPFVSLLVLVTAIFIACGPTSRTKPVKADYPSNLAGDVTGPAAFNVLSKIDGVSLPAPSGTNTVPTFAAGALTWANPSVTVSGTGLVHVTAGTVDPTAYLGTAGQLPFTSVGAAATQWASCSGDVTCSATTVGTYTTVGINTATVPAAGALTIGNVLKVAGSSALTYGPVDLSSANAVANVLSAGNLPVATTSALGIIELGGDLHGGTDTAPTVTGIQTNTVSAGALTKGQFFVASTTSNWAATTLSQDVTESATTPGQLTVTQFQNGEELVNTAGTITWAAGATPILTQSSVSTVGVAGFEITPQASTNANGNGGIIQLNLPTPTGTGTEGYTAFSRAGTVESEIGGVPTVASTQQALWLQTTTPSTTNYAVKSDASNLYLNATNAAGAIQFLAANSVVGVLEATSGRGTFWALPGGVGNSTSNLAIESDGTSLTYFNGPGSLALLLNGSSFAAYATTNGIILGGSTSTFGGGTKVVTITNATVAPTTLASAGTANLWNTTSGLFYSGSSGTTNFDPIAIAPFHSISAMNTQFVGTNWEKEWVRTTAETPVTACAIPVPNTAECVGVQVNAVGRLSTGITDATYSYGQEGWCSNGSTLVAGTPTTSNMTIGAAAGTLQFSTSGVNGLVQVESVSAITIDWTVDCKWTLN